MITKEQKEYCIHNLAAMVTDKIYQSKQAISYTEAASQFLSSSTYEQLTNYKTHLWAEGPDYIYGLYKEELQI